MSDLFYQRPLDSWTYESVKEFLADQVPEYDRLEYKAPVPTKDGGAWSISDDVLKTIVAMANTSGGMIFYGVASGSENKPGKIVGCDANDPERTVRSKCAAQIEPTLWLETKSINIPDGEPVGGRKLLLVRVRAGSNPPYSLRRVGVFMRTGEEDRQATVRDLEALFARRPAATAPTETPWWQMGQRIFAYGNQHLPDKPPVAMVGLTPVFPIEPIALNEDTDRQFSFISLRLFDESTYFMEPHAVSYPPPLLDQVRVDPAALRAYDDGSIGVRRAVPCTFDPDGEGVRRVRIVELWKLVREMMTHAAAWPRAVCQYAGPLRYRMSLGNLSDVILNAPDLLTDPPSPLLRAAASGSTDRNTMPMWDAQGEWDNNMSVDDAVQREFALLARQLQCSFYSLLQNEIRQALQSAGTQSAGTYPAPYRRP